MIYMSQFNWFLIKASGRGLALEILSFLGPKWHSTIGPMPFHSAQKTLDFQWVQPPPTCPRNVSARIKNIMNGAAV